MSNVIYTAIFFNTEEIVNKFGQVHENLFSHHSTIEFKPVSIDGLPIGETMNVKIVGRLTTKRLDVLLVENKLSTKKNPHITLSTAEGVKPFESNFEIEAHYDEIKPLNDSIVGVVGYFNGKDITKPLD